MRKGIIFPKGWEKIVTENKVVGEEGELRVITVEELETVLVEKLKQSIDRFDGREFCLALSGDIDSFVLAVLLAEQKVKFTAITIAAGRNHQDVIHIKKLARKFKLDYLDHKVCILGHRRMTQNIYSDLFYIISSFGFQCAICADAVDEMLGGYILHRDAPEEKRIVVFENFWQKLVPEHLELMRYYAKEYNVAVVLPYLAAHDFLRQIAMPQRVNRGQGKVILRQLAGELGVPKSIINRRKYERKYGLCSVWEKF